MKIHKPRDIHMTSDARLLCLQSDWFRQHSGANAVHLHHTFLTTPPFLARAPFPQRAHANTYGPRDYTMGAGSTWRRAQRQFEFHRARRICTSTHSTESYRKPPTFSALFFSLTRTATRQTCLPGSRRSWRDERARQVARLVSWSAGLASGALMPGAGDGGRRYL